METNSGFYVFCMTDIDIFNYIGACSIKFINLPKHCYGKIGQDWNRMPQTLQIITNIVVIACIVYLLSEVKQINNHPESEAYQEAVLAIPDNYYIDTSAIMCPSSFDEATKRFRNENYWIFQKKQGDKNISLVLRPNRDTGNWDRDVDTTNNKMTITPDFYEWESFIYTGLNVLNRKDLTLERKRSDLRSATSQCELISPEAARDEVESRYKRLLEGNKL